MNTISSESNKVRFFISGDVCHIWKQRNDQNCCKYLYLESCRGWHSVLGHSSVQLNSESSSVVAVRSWHVQGANNCKTLSLCVVSRSTVSPWYIFALNGIQLKCITLQHQRSRFSFTSISSSSQ